MTRGTDPEDFTCTSCDEISRQELARRAERWCLSFHPVDHHRGSRRRSIRRSAIPPAFRSSLVPAANGNRREVATSWQPLELLVREARRTRRPRDCEARRSRPRPRPARRRRRAGASGRLSTARTEHERDIGDPRRVEPVEPGALCWYRPGGSAGYRYPPAASGAISSARPFSFQTATDAPGRTPPCTSRTTPWTEPVCSWPATVAAARRQQVTAAARKGVITTPARRPIRGTGRVRGRIRWTTRRWAPP